MEFGMTTVRPAALLLVLVTGCGGATAASPDPSTPDPSTPDPAPTEQATEARSEPVDWLSSDLVGCVRGAPEPAGAPIAGAGTSVRVRASSIAFEDGEDHIVCEARGPLAGQLVLIVGDIGGVSVGGSVQLTGSEFRFAFFIPTRGKTEQSAD